MVSVPPTHNLPPHLASFVGREREIAQAKRLLGRSRLLTLTGPGGTGKSRLATELAQRLLAEFRDGVFFVALASVADPKLVIPTIAQTLNVSEVPGRPLFDTLITHLVDKQVLLVLDNFEHLLPAAIEVGQLAAACALLQVIVTSRERLRLQGEHELQVPPLSLPPVGVVRELVLQPEQLTRYEAVHLFAERAVAWKPDFVVDNSNASAVAEICHWLDGLPLAIELAAARIKLLSPQAMLRRFGSRLRLLTGGSRDLPARHQTLRGVIDWSYSLLDEQEQRLFWRVSVFAGGCTLEAVEAVCSFRSGPTKSDSTTTDPQFAVPNSQSQSLLDVLASLVDKGLLNVVEPGAGGSASGISVGPGQHQGEGDGQAEPRFSMLQIVREYAAERLVESGEEEAVRRQHALFYLALAEKLEWTRSAQLEWLGQLEAEHDNLLSALRWSVGGDENTNENTNENANEKQETGNLEIALRLGAALAKFWLLHGHLLEGCQWLDRLSTLSVGASKELRVPVLYGTAMLNFPSGSDREYVEALYQEAITLSCELGDKQHMAWCLNDLGLLAVERGDLDQAEALYEESLAIKRDLGNTRDTVIAHNNLAFVARGRGNYEQAAARFEETIALVRSFGDQGDGPLLANLLNNPGHLALQMGNYQKARSYFEESLSLSRGLGGKLTIGESLAGLGMLSEAAGDWGRAARLLGAAETLLEKAGGTLMWAPDGVQLQRSKANARARLGEAAWEEAQAEVRASSIEDAIRFALEDVPFSSQLPATTDVEQPTQPQPSRRNKVYPNDLTHREVEVLRSVAQGLSNPQVAEHLSLSRNTVEAHLRSIFRKINVSTRTAATRFAIEHRLA